jgi:hypothetical protein
MILIVQGPESLENVNGYIDKINQLKGNKFSEDLNSVLFPTKAQ